MAGPFHDDVGRDAHGEGVADEGATAGGMDWQAKRLEETGLALIPGVDEYEIVK